MTIFFHVKRSVVAEPGTLVLPSSFFEGDKWWIQKVAIWAPARYRSSCRSVPNGMMEGENHSRYRDTIGESECLALPWQWEP